MFGDVSSIGVILWPAMHTQQKVGAGLDILRYVMNPIGAPLFEFVVDGKGWEAQVIDWMSSSHHLRDIQTTRREHLREGLALCVCAAPKGDPMPLLSLATHHAFYRLNLTTCRHLAQRRDLDMRKPLCLRH